MLDSVLYPYVEPHLKTVAGVIRPLNISATTITLAGLVFAVLAFISLISGQYLNALIFILLNRFMDGLDGVVARDRAAEGKSGGVTDFGAYLDIVTDYVFYTGVVFFFALGTRGAHDAMAAAWLLFSYVGTGTTFLAYAVFAERHGLPGDINLNEWAKNKGFYYLGGLTEGAETLIYMVAICLLPALFMPLSIIFGILCWITTATRVMSAFDTFSEAAVAEKPAPKASKTKAPAKKKPSAKKTTTKKKSG